MEGHIVGRFGEGAEDADEGEAGLGRYDGAGQDDPFQIVRADWIEPATRSLGVVVNFT